MKDVADALRDVVKTAVPSLNAVAPAAAAHAPSTGGWSPQEILGHLIDSACNNQQKFVRLVSSPTLSVVGYDQDAWVKTQGYQHATWADLVSLWATYNVHMAHIIEHVPADARLHAITIDSAGPFTFEFILRDYVEHAKHHLLKIDPSMPFTASFDNVYKG